MIHLDKVFQNCFFLKFSAHAAYMKIATSIECYPSKQNKVILLLNIFIYKASLGYELVGC